MITKVSTVNMPHGEWLERRRRSVGGSDAAAIVGLNDYVSPFALWSEKTGRVPGFAGNLATEVGTFLEEFVAQKFAAETGKKVRRENAFIYNDKYPWAHANVDRVICNESALLEIKTTDSMNMKKFKNGEYPAHYYAQCVHYLGLTGKDRCYLAVLIGNKDFKWFTIERDQEEIDALMKAEETFWKTYVEKDVPPLPDGSNATTDAIGRIYRESTGGEVDLFNRGSLVAEYFRLKQTVDELDSRMSEISNVLKLDMGDAEKGLCGSYKVSWASQTRRTFDAKAFAAQNPGVDLTPYYKTTVVRPFKLTQTTK